MRVHVVLGGPGTKAHLAVEGANPELALLNPGSRCSHARRSRRLAANTTIPRWRTGSCWWAPIACRRSAVPEARSPKAQQSVRGAVTTSAPITFGGVLTSQPVAAVYR